MNSEAVVVERRLDNRVRMRKQFRAIGAATHPPSASFPKPMTDLLADPWFFAAALPAVILVGLSKGGFGGAMGFVGVPLMSLVMIPVQAAAILLPILVLMDLVSLWTWRGVYDRATLAIMLPGSLLGIGIGWLTAAMVTADMVRFIVGAIAIVFVGAGFFSWRATALQHATKPNRSQAPSGGWSPASPASSPMSAARRSRSTRCRSGWIRKSSPARA